MVDAKSRRGETSQRRGYGEERNSQRIVTAYKSSGDQENRRADHSWRHRVVREKEAPLWWLLNLKPYNPELDSAATYCRNTELPGRPKRRHCFHHQKAWQETQDITHAIRKGNPPPALLLNLHVMRTRSTSTELTTKGGETEKRGGRQRQQL